MRNNRRKLVAIDSHGMVVDVKIGNIVTRYLNLDPDIYVVEINGTKYWLRMQDNRSFRSIDDELETVGAVWLDEYDREGDIHYTKLIGFFM